MKSLNQCRPPQEAARKKKVLNEIALDMVNLAPSFATQQVFEQWASRELLLSVGRGELGLWDAVSIWDQVQNILEEVENG